MAQSATRAWKGIRTHWEEKEYYRRRFSTCLDRAKAVIEVVSNQNGSSLTYPDLLDIMALRSGLDDESLGMEKEINYFLDYDTVLAKEAAFYTEILATEETIADALSLSGDFLRRLTDVDNIIQDSHIICIRLAADIMALVNRGTNIDPVELMELRDALRKKFGRLKGSWENILKA